MNPLVSVVIPVYNTEKYLEECVLSVLEQTYKNIEIILVDDGSKDQSGEICDRLSNENGNIKVIHNTNSGSGVSRNLGFDKSEGEYIVFMDSDDKLDGKESISLMVEKALEEDSDIVVGCYRRFDNDYLSGVNRHGFTKEDTWESADFRFRGFYRNGHLAYVWAKLYKKDFLKYNNIRHDQYPFTQDKAFNMRCLSHKPKYGFLNESVYCYRINISSVTYKYKKNFSDIWISIAKDFSESLKGYDADFSDLTSFHIILGAYYMVKQEVKNGARVKECISGLKKYCENAYSAEQIRIVKKNSKNIKSFKWKVLFNVTEFVLKTKCYTSFVLGVGLIQKIDLEKKISEKRYRK